MTPKIWDDLRAHQEHLEDMAENARFARRLQLAGRKRAGLSEVPPEDEADMPWVKLGVDHVDLIIKVLDEAAELIFRGNNPG